MKIDPTIKKIQKIALDIYMSFSKLCEEHDLQYFAMSGTAIGAELWQGFIPWDDDMDIAMPLGDFEKFRKGIYKFLPEVYGYIEIPGFGIKIYDKRTTLIEAPYILSPTFFGGVFIDVVPLIGLPDDPEERFNFRMEIKTYLAETLALNRAPEITKFTGQTSKKITEWRKRLISKYPFGTTEYCTDFSCDKCPEYTTKGFLEPRIMKFENTTIPASSLQSTNLEASYGKIIKYIPESERAAHFDSFAIFDSDTPCQKYVDSFQKMNLPDWFENLLRKNLLLVQLYGRNSTLQAIDSRILQKQLQSTQEELNILRSSPAYKIGKAITNPISTAKIILHKKTKS